MMTQERKQQLLAGNDHRSDARSAPAWAQERIVEIRNALAEGRPIPPPSPAWVAEAEKRYAAARHKVALRHLAEHTTKPTPSAAALASAEDEWLRKRAADVAETIRADAARSHDDEDDPDDPFDDDYDKEDHERCAESHRNLARKAKSLDEACAHYNAADAHARAAKTEDPSDSRHAQGLSYSLKKKQS
jgi:hypothetical protein